jgi:hypothetical protein
MSQKDNKRPAGNANCLSCRQPIGNESYVELREVKTNRTRGFLHDNEQCRAVMILRDLRLIE